jgi:hypothetical protein
MWPAVYLQAYNFNAVADWMRDLDLTKVRWVGRYPSMHLISLRPSHFMQTLTRCTIASNSFEDLCIGLESHSEECAPLMSR